MKLFLISFAAWLVCASPFLTVIFMSMGTRPLTEEEKSTLYGYGK